MDSMSGSDFIAEPLWIFLILLKDLSHFFAIIFGFVAILFRKTLFIGQEEEFFLGFIILVENHFKLQLIVNFQMHPVGLKLDHVVLLKCNNRLRRLNENKLIYVPRQYFLMTDVNIFFMYFFVNFQ